ncbi:uncharacterized protein [Clytia hemisphaerica]|uniref:uncharacterized protein n=1 Tax=Clytia hemisphaerica TaxID=252671 RepID=UPI0034D73CC7
MWIHGPEFLWQDESMWKKSKPSTKLNANDTELKKVNAIMIKDATNNVFLRLIKQISNWKRLCRIVALIVRFVRIICKAPNIERSLHPTIEEVNGAERLIITTTQQVKFTDEIAALQKQNHVSEHSPISSLNPFIDESGVLRVGGRLRRSNLDFKLRHPILLPKNHELSESIVRWCHEKCTHRGRLHTLHELRNHGFWVVNGNTFVRKIIYHCVICRYLRGSTSNQIMADLPKARVVESPPFTYVGVDFFGPFIVKELRRELKRYGVIFTCFSTRAVHLEVSSSLETDTFIMTLRRFISRRGKVRSMHSDNGTNFVGTERELKKAISEMDHERIAKYMNEQDGDWIWKFNPPASSQWVVCGERHIRSIRPDPCCTLEISRTKSKH